MEKNYNSEYMQRMRIKAYARNYLNNEIKINAWNEILQQIEKNFELSDATRQPLIDITLEELRDCVEERNKLLNDLKEVVEVGDA